MVVHNANVIKKGKMPNAEGLTLIPAIAALLIFLYIPKVRQRLQKNANSEE
jgi:hypothetical protein